ncbi:MAG: hypothetical protein IIZ92_24800 [Aquincola sp.]|nr:hypothetical protein [Aquincola sp.]|tara:strand:- start:1460 stop:1753 length:294 start_codon:yes stop_codon:yes gene_type:complete
MLNDRARAFCLAGGMVALSLALASLSASAGLLNKVLGRSDPSEPLPPEKAFQIKVEAVDDRTVVPTLTRARERPVSLPRFQSVCYPPTQTEFPIRLP